jgi:glycosyltransferase involved in cell wall biosynthesis
MKQQQPLSGIVVLNKNYFPKEDSEGFKVGATSFAMNIVECLDRNTLLLGLLLYERDEAITTPTLEEGATAGLRTITLRFNFRMAKEVLERHIGSAIRTLGQDSATPPLVYYQTDTLLAYHPESIPYCVTHHGPFVEDFSSVYSDNEAYQAYGGEEKVKHLLKEQRRGIDALKRRGNAYVLQHSELQKTHLVQSGVDQSIIRVMSPPILCRDVECAELDPELQRFLLLDTEEVVLVSNVARVDYFKNLEMLVEATLQLIRKGLSVKVMITGGASVEVGKRQALRDLIPEHLQYRFLIIGKLDQAAMFALFERIKNKGIFVCTSRYETLGITPLEAALSGVCTIAPDLHCVELSKYLPEQYKYNYSVEGLVNKLFELKATGGFRSDIQYKYLSKRISRQAFEDSFMTCWSEISKTAAQRTVQDGGTRSPEPALA